MTHTETKQDHVPGIPGVTPSRHHRKRAQERFFEQSDVLLAAIESNEFTQTQLDHFAYGLAIGECLTWDEGQVPVSFLVAQMGEASTEDSDRIYRALSGHEREEPHTETRGGPTLLVEVTAGDTAAALRELADQVEAGKVGHEHGPQTPFGRSGLSACWQQRNEIGEGQGVE